MAIATALTGAPSSIVARRSSRCARRLANRLGVRGRGAGAHQVPDITAAHVGELGIVWHWEPNEMPLEVYGIWPGQFQATSIMVGNVLYLSTTYSRVPALDAETGTELWTYSPRTYEGGPKGASPTGFRNRGVAWWSEGPAACIFLNSRDWLYAIDAATGERTRASATAAGVLLPEGHGRPVSRHEFDQTSPPERAPRRGPFGGYQGHFWAALILPPKVCSIAPV